jgi:hypothetical protein
MIKKLESQKSPIVGNCRYLHAKDCYCCYNYYYYYDHFLFFGGKTYYLKNKFCLIKIGRPNLKVSNHQHVCSHCLLCNISQRSCRFASNLSPN